MGQTQEGAHQCTCKRPNPRPHPSPSLYLMRCSAPSQTRKPTTPNAPELKADAKGRKEFEGYRTKLMIQRAELVENIEKDKAWIVSRVGPRAGAGAAAWSAGAGAAGDVWCVVGG